MPKTVTYRKKDQLRTRQKDLADTRVTKTRTMGDRSKKKKSVYRRGGVNGSCGSLGTTHTDSNSDGSLDKITKTRRAQSFERNDTNMVVNRGYRGEPFASGSPASIQALRDTPPTIKLALPDLTGKNALTANDTIDLSNHFEDTDGDAFSYGIAVTGTAGVLTSATESGGTLTLDYGSTVGTATVTVTGTANGISVSDAFDVTLGYVYELDATYGLNKAPIQHYDAANMEGGNATTRNGNSGWSDGDAVGTWKDRSGNGTSQDAAQTNATYKPSFNTGSGDPYVSFDGDYMSVANGPTIDTQTSGCTIIIMANSTGAGKDIVGIGSDTDAAYGASFVLESYGTGALIYGGGGTENSFVNLQSSASALFREPNMFTATKSAGGVASDLDNCLWYVSGGTSVYDQGDMIGSNTDERPATDQFKLTMLGYTRRTMQTFPAGQNLYETMIFDSLLSTAELNTVKDYLAAKWSTPIAAGTNTLGAFS